MKWTIFGAGDLIWDIIDAIESREENYVSFIVLNQTIKDNLDPYEVWSLKRYLKPKIASYEREHRIFGFIDPNKQKFLKQLGGVEFSNVIHARSWACNTSGMGYGNFFGANSTLASKTSLGNFNYINRNASIGHHTIIGSYNHVGPGATICGKCNIGNNNFFGAGCVVKDGINFGNNVIVGANALVITDLLEKGVYIGSPAKYIDKVPDGVVGKFYDAQSL